MIDHLSASSIKTFLTCQRKFWLEQVGLLQTATSSVSANFGKLFHSALEGPEQSKEAFKQLRDTDDTFYTPKLLETSLKAYEKHEEAFLVKPDAKMREVCFQINTLYWPIIGYMDFVYQYGQELIFGDDKTTQRDMNTQYLKSLQYKLYSIALHTGTDSAPRKKKVNVIALRKSGRVDINTYTDFISKKELAASKYFLSQTLRQINHAFHIGSFYPNMLNCDPQPGEGFKCGFRNLCWKHINEPIRILKHIALEEGIAILKESKEHTPVFVEYLQ